MTTRRSSAALPVVLPSPTTLTVTEGGGWACAENSAHDKQTPANQRRRIWGGWNLVVDSRPCLQKGIGMMRKAYNEIVPRKCLLHFICASLISIFQLQN